VDQSAFPYRAPGERPPPAVVDFRHFPPWVPATVAAAIVAFVILSSHRVDLTCERGGACVATDRHVAWSSEPVHVDLALVRGATLLYGPKRATRVALVTKLGNLPLSGSTDSVGDDSKRAVIAAVQSFVAGDGEDRLEVGYGSRWASNLWGLLLLFPFALIAAVMARRVRVVVDRAAGAVSIERSRFPLQPSMETWGIGDVVGAAVEASSGGRGGTVYRVALVLGGGDRVPLTRGYSSGSGRKERVAAAIRAALADRG
jgi:hypothetical protein